MSDEQTLEELVDEYDSELDAEEDEEQEKRGSRGLVAVVLAVVIVIIVLLLLRDCGGAESGRPSAGKKTIESVSGMQPAKALVSVWISDKTNIDGALAAAKVSSSDLIDLGGGRYVISVPKGSEDGAVKRLCDTAGVYDAGLVYERGEK